MWRRLAVWVAPSVLGILVVGSGMTVADIHRTEAAQRAAQARQARQLAQATTAQRLEMVALQKTATDLTATVQQRDQLQAKADDLQGQVDKLKDQIAALQAASVGLGSGPAAQTVGVTAGPVLFPWGYCTWYVATRRLVNWTGNAIDWWWNAARAGRPEGSQPRVGAIQVSRDSIWGHVAYVEAVNGNGSWVVSEMNFNAWGMVDRRTVWPGGTLIGFIY